MLGIQKFMKSNLYSIPTLPKSVLEWTKNILPVENPEPSDSQAFELLLNTTDKLRKAMQSDLDHGEDINKCSLPTDNEEHHAIDLAIGKGDKFEKFYNKIMCDLDENAKTLLPKIVLLEGKHRYKSVYNAVDPNIPSKDDRIIVGKKGFDLYTDDEKIFLIRHELGHIKLQRGYSLLKYSRVLNNFEELEQANIVKKAYKKCQNGRLIANIINGGLSLFGDCWYNVCRTSIYTEFSWFILLWIYTGND